MYSEYNDFMKPNAIIKHAGNRKIAIIMNYTSHNRNSFNSLLGALEVNPDIKVDIYFAVNEQEILSLLRQCMDSYCKIILAFSFFTCHLQKIARTISVIIKEMKSARDKNKILLIAGGPHASGDPRGTLEIGFDFVFMGESEESFPNFLRAIIDNNDCSGIKGLMYKYDGEHIFTGKTGPVDLDFFPPFSSKHKKFGPIEITRGCPFCCYYCQTPQLFGARVRHRSKDVILDYVKDMRQHKLRDVRFVSPDAFAYGSNDGKKINLEAIESLFSEIYNEINPNGRQFIASFPSEVRPEHVTEETLDIVLRYGANRNIIFGAQTGSERLLENINRGHTIEDVYSAVDICIKKKITPHVDFIFGLPGENEEDVLDTMKMINDLVSNGAVIHAHRFFPLPQTVFSKERPGEIDKKLVRLLGELGRKGLAYGNVADSGL